MRPKHASSPHVCDAVFHLSPSTEDIFYTPQGSASAGSGGHAFTPQHTRESVYVTPGEGPSPRRDLDGVARQLEGVAVGGEGGIYAHQVIFIV